MTTDLGSPASSRAESTSPRPASSAPAAGSTTGGPPLDSNLASSQRRRFSWRWLISLVLIPVLLVGSYTALTVMATWKPAPQRREAAVRTLSVETFAVDPVSVQLRIPAFGAVRSDRRVKIMAQVGGQIVETFRLDEGQRVTAPSRQTDPQGMSAPVPGDVLVQVDKRDYLQRLAQAEDRLAENAAEIERVKQEQVNLERKVVGQKQDVETYSREVARVRGLMANGVVTETQLQDVELQLRRYDDALLELETQLALIPSRRTQLEQRRRGLENDLKLAELDLERTTVRPPFDGYVMNVAVDEGQFVRPGDPLFELVDFSSVEIPIPIPLDRYRDLETRVRAEDFPVAEVSTSDDGSIGWLGNLVRIAPMADTQTRTLEGYVIVDNREQAAPLLPGAFVRVSLLGERRENVLAIPRDAIVNDAVYVLRPTAYANGGESTLDTAKAAGLPDAVERRPITVADTVETIAFVSAGLQSGERILLTNQDVITELTAANEPFLTREAATQTLRDEARLRKPRLWRLIGSE